MGEQLGGKAVCYLEGISRDPEKAYMPGIHGPGTQQADCLQRSGLRVESPCIELCRAVEISRWLGPHKA